MISNDVNITISDADVADAIAKINEELPAIRLVQCSIAMPGQKC